MKLYVKSSNYVSAGIIDAIKKAFKQFESWLKSADFNVLDNEDKEVDGVPSNILRLQTGDEKHSFKLIAQPASNNASDCVNLILIGCKDKLAKVEDPSKRVEYENVRNNQKAIDEKIYECLSEKWEWEESYIKLNNAQYIVPTLDAIISCTACGDVCMDSFSANYPTELALDDFECVKQDPTFISELIPNSTRKCTIISYPDCIEFKFEDCR